MDADSDLEEFERNQVEKLRGGGSLEDSLDADTELGRQATNLDKKPGSLESESEALSRNDVGQFVNDLEEDRIGNLRREDTEIEKVPAENTEAATQYQGTMKMSIQINSEPMTHEYADVEHPQK